MRCYYVHVHGTLHWNDASVEADVNEPRGFYCHRYVLASDEENAARIAFNRVRANFNKGLGWLSDGTATLTLAADEIRTAPVRKLLEPDNRGHTFYGKG